MKNRGKTAAADMEDLVGTYEVFTDEQKQLIEDMIVENTRNVLSNLSLVGHKQHGDFYSSDRIVLELCYKDEMLSEISVDLE